MPSTAEEILDSFPEFDDVDQATLDLYLALARANLVDLWGDERYEYACAAYAAFMMMAVGIGTGGTASGASGEVTSKRIGSLAVSYATPNVAGSGVPGAGLDSNKYGRLLLQLLAGQIVPMLTTDTP